MEITFDLQHWFSPDTSTADNAFALRALLDCLCNINQSYLRNHRVPPLYKAGVVYRRTEVWDAIPALYSRGYGDCKSLACALVAEYRHHGIPAQPTFRWVERKGAPILTRDFHILVQTPSGYEDPSKVLGMGADEIAPISQNDLAALGGRR